MARILIVDDEAVITLQLEERLAAMGYTVAGIAANGDAAVRMAREIRPDLVLMDIVMPGKTNGIDAAGVVTGELGIPVIFVTSYADDTIIEKAKKVRPSGFIVKPFNEREVKAAIEMALFRQSLETGEPGIPGAADQPAPGSGTEEIRFLDGTRNRTLLLDDIFTGLVLFLYTDPVVKEPVFQYALEEGIRKGGCNLFAYFAATVHRHYAKEIQTGVLRTHRLKKNELLTLVRDIETCRDAQRAGPSTGTVRVLLDFADSDEFDDILAVIEVLVHEKASGIPIAGMIAVDASTLDHARIALLAEHIQRVILSNGRDTTLSFAHHTFADSPLEIVPQDTIGDVVKKSLEPVVLSLLDRPISGFDIVHEIHNRYKVLIPQARVYSLLYDLERKGYLVMRHSGKSKLYFQTDTGKKYISARLADFRSVYRHILGGNGSGK